MQTGVIWPYLRQQGVYHCPLDVDSAAWTGSHVLTSYLMNGSQNAFQDKGPTWIGYKFTQIAQSADRILFWEAQEGTDTYTHLSSTGATWNDGSSRASEEIVTDRHKRGTNVAFLDGHVDYWDWATFYYNADRSYHGSRTALQDHPTARTPLFWSLFTQNGRP
jgi:prepilin-type processing-associated H-X9-DG protein